MSVKLCGLLLPGAPFLVFSSCRSYSVIKNAFKTGLEGVALGALFKGDRAVGRGA